MKIQVLKAEMSERTVVRRRDSKSFTFREQSAVVDLPNGERRVIAVSLEEGHQPYPVGSYILQDSSFFVDRNGRLSLGRLHLAPAAQAVEGRRQAG